MPRCQTPTRGATHFPGVRRFTPRRASGAVGLVRFDAGILADDTDSATGQDLLSERFTPGSGAPALVRTEGDHVDEVVRAAEGVDGVDSAVAYTGDDPVTQDSHRRRTVSCASTPPWTAPPRGTKRGRRWSGCGCLVALSVDYSIFLMPRVCEETRTVGIRQGALNALVLTGGLITSAGVVLAATFSALAVMPLIMMIQLAFTVALGLLSTPSSSVRPSSPP